MGYLCILLSLLAGTTKGFTGKKISCKIITQRQSVFVNMVRMVICVFISAIVLLIETHGQKIVIDSPAIIYGVMAGMTISVFCITWLLAIRHGAFMLISVAQMFGVVITLICSMIVFREEISPVQWLAIVILIAAVLVMISYNNQQKGKLTVSAVILLILCGVSNGLYDFSQKLFTSFSESGISTLNLITYALSSFVLGAMLLFPSASDRFDRKQLLKGTFGAVFIMSVCLFLNSYFKALATEYLPATQIYPIYQAGGIAASAIISAVFFKERITARCVVGLILALISILLLKA